MRLINDPVISFRFYPLFLFEIRKPPFELFAGTFYDINSTIIIHTESKEQENALKAFAKALKMKFEVAKEKPYNPEFVEKIQESRKQAKEGKVTRVKKENLKEFLGL